MWSMSMVFFRKNWSLCDLSNELSLCHHCHPADGALDPRDPLVRNISLNILAEMNKEVEKSRGS